MKKVKKSEGTFYEAHDHFNVWSTRKLGDQDTKRLKVSVSHFLPNGGVNMSGSAAERMYYVISGSMVVKTNDQEYTLEQGDIVYFAPDEVRSIKVTGPDVCSILVAMVKV